MKTEIRFTLLLGAILNLCLYGFIFASTDIKNAGSEIASQIRQEQSPTSDTQFFANNAQAHQPQLPTNNSSLILAGEYSADHGFSWLLVLKKEFEPSLEGEIGGKFFTEHKTYNHNLFIEAAKTIFEEKSKTGSFQVSQAFKLDYVNYKSGVHLFLLRSNLKTKKTWGNITFTNGVLFPIFYSLSHPSYTVSGDAFSVLGYTITNLTLTEYIDVSAVYYKNSAYLGFNIIQFPILFNISNNGGLVIGYPWHAMW